MQQKELTMAEATPLQQVYDYANRPNPYPFYAELCKTPVVREPDGSYVVSTYWEIHELMHDPRVSSDVSKRPSPERPVPRTPGEAQAMDVGFLNSDPPLHDHLRMLATRYFGPPHSPRRVYDMRPGMAELVRGLVDKFDSKGQIDLVDEFAYPVPVTVICNLLGIPKEDEAQFHAWADAIVNGLDLQFEPDPAEVQRRRAASFQGLQALGQYMQQMLQRYRSQPADTFLSFLVNDDGPEGRMTPGQVLATANLLLLAGHETTVNLIANSMLTFLRHPDIIERLKAEPSFLAPTIEEMLRYEPSVQMLPNRMALDEIEVAGVTIPSGAAMTLVIAAGNRDPLRFPDPDPFDPERKDNQHLGFGSGIHACFGAPLARLEAHAALGELIRRLVNPRLVVDPPEYRPSPILRGPRHLLIEVDGIEPS
jgi:cytochrome P450